MALRRSPPFPYPGISFGGSAPTIDTPPENEQPTPEQVPPITESLDESSSFDIEDAPSPLSPFGDKDEVFTSSISEMPSEPETVAAPAKRRLLRPSLPADVRDGAAKEEKQQE